MPIYKLNGDTYNIPDDVVSSFESDHPEATVRYKTKEGYYNIPVKHRDGFLKKYPDAEVYNGKNSQKEDITQGKTSTETNPLDQPLHVEVPEPIRSANGLSGSNTNSAYTLPETAIKRPKTTGSEPEDDRLFEENMQRMKEGKPLNRVTTQSVIDANPDLGLQGSSYQPTEEEIRSYTLRNKPGMFKNRTSSLIDKPLGDAAESVEGYGDKANARVDLLKKYYSGDEFKQRIKKETGARVTDLLEQTDADLNTINEKISAHQKAMRNENWRPGMPSSRDDNTLVELRRQRTLLNNAENILDDSRKIVDEAGKKDSSWYESLGRGVRDKVFDVDSWTMGITDMAGSMNLNKVLEKADREEELDPAEQRLLDAAVTNMAVNAYYSSDLSAAYKAGQVTGESIPFMLEMAVNPISASGNATAKLLLKYGLKKFGQQIGKNVGKTIGAAAGMTATTGMPGVIGGAYDRMNGQIQFGLDDKGQLTYTGRKGNMGAGEAFAKSAASRFLENHSEMVFNAFNGMGDVVWRGVQKIVPEGVNGFIQKASGTGAGKMIRDWGNNETMKELAKRTQFHGIAGEYLEEVYNNLANVPLGEMTMEQVLDLDQNIDTFLGLAPTSVFFGVLGLGSMTAERIQHKKKMEAAFGNMTKVQRDKLAELERMSKQNGNADIRTFIKETMADPNLTREQKRQEIEYAYDIAVNTAFDEVAQEQAREQAESRSSAQEEGAAAYASGDPSAVRESVVREEVSRERLEEVLPDIELLGRLYQADDAGRAEILGELPEEVRERAKEYLYSVDKRQAVEDAIDEAHAPEVEAAEARVAEMTQHGRVTVVSLGKHGDATHTHGVVVNGLDENGSTTTNGGLIMVDPIENGPAGLNFGTYDSANSKPIQMEVGAELIQMSPEDVTESMLGSYQEDVDNLQSTPILAGHRYELTDESGQSAVVEVQSFDMNGNVSVLVNGQPSVFPENQLQEMVEGARRLAVEAEYAGAEAERQALKDAAKKEAVSLETKRILPDGRLAVLSSSYGDEVAYDIVDTNGNVMDSDTMPASEFEALNIYEPESSSMEEETEDFEPQGEIGTKSEDNAKPEEIQSVSDGLPRKKDGTLDYDAFTPQQAYEYTSRTESPEVALEDLKSDIEESDRKLSSLREQLSSASRGKRISLRDTIRQAEAENQALKEFLNTVAPAATVMAEEEVSRQAEEPAVEYPQAEAEAEEEEVETIRLEDKPRKKYQPEKAKPFEATSEEMANSPVAQEILARTEPETLEELASVLLGNSIYLQMSGERATREMTGFGHKDLTPFLRMFRGKDKGGMTVEAAGDKLLEAARESYPEIIAKEGLENDNTGMAGTNAILSLISQSRTFSDISGYIRKNRIAEAQSAMDAENEYNERMEEEWIWETYHTDKAGLEALDNGEAFSETNAHTEEEIVEFYNNFADEILKEQYYDRRNEGVHGQGIGESQTDDSRGVHGIREGSDNVLRQAQPVLSNGEEGNSGESGQVYGQSTEDVHRQNDAVQGSSSGKEIASQIESARAAVAANPTEAQKEAGNYKKGHVRIDGYEITIENPKGGIRSGTDRSGKKWSITMNNDYGYIRGTEAVDGDHIDVFLSDAPDSGRVFVVDQANEDGSFDESKVMYGFNSLEEARAAYLSNYEKGWESRIMAITEVSKEEFRKWIGSSHRKTKAFSEYKSVKAYGPSIESSNVSRMQDIENRLAEIEDRKIEISDLKRDQSIGRIELAYLLIEEQDLNIEQLELEAEYSGLRAMNDESNAISEAEGSDLRFRKSDEKEEKRRIPLRDRAKDWEKKLGVKVNIMESLDDVTNKDARRAIQRGAMVTGWFEESTGEVCLFMPYLESEGEIDATYIHEVVAHKGLRGLLGDKFDSFLDKVWESMPEADRTKYLSYPGVNGDSRAAADEYIAHLAENVDVTESAWSKFTELFKKFLKAIGLEPKITDADIANTIKKSYQRLVANGRAEFSGVRNFVISDSSDLQNNERTRFSVYKSKDGKETKYKQLFLFDERGEAVNDGNRSDNIQWEGDSTIERLNHLRELQEGEVCNVERKFTESKEFSFTRGEKVESTADVAFVFKSLEDEAVENSFVAITNGDNVSVFHLGMGAQTETVVDTSAVLAAVDRLDADKVFFVHNHPSGMVKCSRQDVLTYQKLKDRLGDKLQDGIIINTRSGKYGLFNSSGLVDNEGRIKEEKNEYPLKVYKFNKQSFNVDVIPTVEASSSGIAEFVSTQRLGKRDKVNALLLNNQFGCVGNILIDNSKNMSYVAERITNDAIAMGARQVVIYGRYPFVEVTDRKTNFASYLSSMINGFSQGNVNLIDIIQIDEPYSKSANDEGVRFRFIGERGARNLDKAEEATTRLDNLAVAREMEASGKDAKTIKAATGWERGADGLWRYEVKDFFDVDAMEKFLRVAFNKTFGSQVTLDRILKEEDTLLKEYPQLKDVAVKFQKLGDAWGTYYPESNVIAINSNFIREEQNIKDKIERQKEIIEDWKNPGNNRKTMDMIKVLELNPEEVLKDAEDKLGKLEAELEFFKSQLRRNLETTIIHEVQHAIQHNEGFAHGGSKNSVRTRKDDLQADVRHLYDMMLDSPEWAEKERLVNEYMDNPENENVLSRIDEIDESGVLDEIKKLQSSLKNKYGNDAVVGKVISSPHSDHDEIWSRLPDSFNDKYDVYNRLAGEVEARNAANRSMSMTQEDMREYLASNTEDVAREDQIFLKDGVESGLRFRVAKEEAEDAIRYFESVVKNHPRFALVNSDSDIDQLDTDRWTKRQLREKAKDPTETGVTIYADDLVVLFGENIDNLEELNDVLSHESAHYVSRKYGVEDIYKASALSYIQKKYPDEFKKIADRYEKGKHSEEALAVLFEKKAKEIGLERLLNATFDTKNDIGYLFNQLKDYLNHERGISGHREGLSDKRTPGTTATEASKDGTRSRMAEGMGQQSQRSSIDERRGAIGTVRAESGATMAQREKRENATRFRVEDNKEKESSYESKIRNLEKAISRYENSDQIRKELIDLIDKELGSEFVGEITKQELRSLLLQVKNAKERRSRKANQAALVKILMNIQSVVLNARRRKYQRNLDKLLSLKVQDVNGKNMSIAKNVDDSTRKIFSYMKGRVADLKISGYDEDIQYLKKEIRGFNEQIQRLERQLEESKNSEKTKVQTEIDRILSKIDENKSLLEELKQLKADVEEAKLRQGDINLDREMKILEEKMDDAAKGEATWTLGDSERLAALNIIQSIMLNKEKDYEVRTIEEEIEKLILNNSSLYKKLPSLTGDNREKINRQIEENRRQIAARTRLINDVRSLQVQQLQETIAQMNELIANGKNSLLKKIEDEAKRKSFLIGKALRSVEGKPVDIYDDKARRENRAKKFFSAPLGSFEYMAKRINTKTLGQDGFFYKYFVESKEGVIEAENTYLKGMAEARRRLDEKTKEIFGKKFETVWKNSDKVEKNSGVYVYDTFHQDPNGYGVKYEKPLSKGQAMYIYMAWKMTDGRTKLEVQGFDEESIAEIVDFIGDDYVKLADWIQEELLSDLREKYNEKYLQMYNTSMANIPNYVPLRIRKEAVRQESDLSEDKERKKTLEERAGSLINRVANTKPVDITMSAFDVIFDHIKQMEEWNAYARVRRDLDAILSNTDFRNQLNANQRGSFENFYDAAAVATRSNRPDKAKYMDEVLGKLSKGIVGGNIAFRLNTALKQLLSAPAFFGYSQHPYFAGHLLKNVLNVTSWASSYRWAKENIPSFRERVESGTAGNEKLNDEVISKALDKYIEWGMIPNKLVDAFVCSVGAKSIYDFKYGRLKAAKVKEEEAKRQAVMEADIYYNATQQSSHPAFMSPVQMSRTFTDRMLTTYQNSNIGYVRRWLSAMYDIMRSLKWKDLKKNYADMYMEQGLTRETAEAKAVARIFNENRKAIVTIALFSYGLNWLWDRGSQGLLGYTGGDDPEEEEKNPEEKLLKDFSYLVTTPIKGLPGGNLLVSLSEGYGMNPFLVYDEIENNMKEIKSAVDKYGLISPEIAYKALDLTTRIGGVDLEVWGNAYMGLEGAFRDGIGHEDDGIINLMLFLNSPKSQREAVAKNIYKDMSVLEYARAVQRAAKYVPKDDPWESWVPGVKEYSKRKESELKKEYKKRQNE